MIGRLGYFSGGAAVLLLAGGCALPSIDLSTQEPIKVDIAMRLDVYQYEADGTKPAASPTSTPTRTPAAGAAGAAAVSTDPAQRREDRAADIQVFKNSRLVGEGRNGLLVILEETPGDYGDYIRETVTAENADRMKLMKQIAEIDKRPLDEVQRGQADLWRNRSFKGEYIEVAGADGKFEWKQKEG